jgi:hypothetical protein
MFEIVCWLECLELVRFKTLLINWMVNMHQTRNICIYSLQKHYFQRNSIRLNKKLSEFLLKWGLLSLLLCFCDFVFFLFFFVFWKCMSLAPRCMFFICTTVQRRWTFEMRQMMWSWFFVDFLRTLYIFSYNGFLLNSINFPHIWSEPDDTIFFRIRRKFRFTMLGKHLVGLRMIWAVGEHPFYFF